MNKEEKIARIEKLKMTIDRFNDIIFEAYNNDNLVTANDFLTKVEEMEIELEKLENSIED